MTDKDDAGQRHGLATSKFNFLAWAARISKKRSLGATDLMVLVQLTVRYDPKFPKFTMSAEALANATNAGLSSVRRSPKEFGTAWRHRTHFTSRPQQCIPGEL